jgi:hypothetical protein
MLCHACGCEALVASMGLDPAKSSPVVIRKACCQEYHPRLHRNRSLSEVVTHLGSLHFGAQPSKRGLRCITIWYAALLYGKSSECQELAKGSCFGRDSVLRARRGRQIQREIVQDVSLPADIPCFRGSAAREKSSLACRAQARARHFRDGLELSPCKVS